MRADLQMHSTTNRSGYFAICMGLCAFVLCSSFALITDYGFVDKQHLVHLDAEYRNVGKAKFTTDSVKGSHERYADAHSYLYFSHYLNDNNALSLKAGYSFLKFDWPKNPRFREDDYHFATSSLGWISTSMKNWRWIVSAAVSVDAQTFDFGKSGVYYGVMWGRYQWRPKIGLHVGWYGYTGVKNGYILPILGFDWHPSPAWQINAIFPVDASIRYYFAEHWSIYLQASAFGRPYRFPIRAHGGTEDAECDLGARAQPARALQLHRLRCHALALRSSDKGSRPGALLWAKVSGGSSATCGYGQTRSSCACGSDVRHPHL